MLLHFNALSVMIMKLYLPFPRPFSLLEILSEDADQLNHWCSMKAAKQQRKVSGVDVRVLGYTVPADPLRVGFVGLFFFWYAAEPAEGSERWLKAVLVHVVHVLIYTPWLLGAVSSPGRVSDLPVLASQGSVPTALLLGTPTAFPFPGKSFSLSKPIFWGAPAGACLAVQITGAATLQ